MQVQQGTVVIITVADQSVALDAGDAVTFSSDVPHSYANPDTRPAKFSLAVFEPSVGSSFRSGVTGG